MGSQDSLSDTLGGLSDNYLSRLPLWARRLGVSRNGEVEVMPEGVDTTSSKCGIVFEDETVMLVRDLVRLPSGHISTSVRLIEKPTVSCDVTGVVIIPEFAGRYWLVRHFRHATRNWELEFPRGYCLASSSIEDNVHRETAEELGSKPLTAVRLGVLTPNSAILVSFVEVWHVRLASIPVVTLDAAEESIAAVVGMTITELKGAVSSGSIRDCFTLSALTLASCKSRLP